MNIFNGNDKQKQPTTDTAPVQQPPTTDVTPAAGTAPVTPAADVKVYKYRCKENCTYQGKYRRTGDTIVLPEKQNVPHFELIEQ